MSAPLQRFRPTGALVYFSVCLGWYGTLTLLALWQGYANTASMLGVPVQDSPFGDMRVVVDGIEAAGKGREDYFLAHVYYHRAWLTFKYVGIRDSDTLMLAIVLGLGMLLHFSLLASQDGNRPLTGFVLAAFACSPPVMLALERGNTDLLLYCILAAACHLLPRRLWTAQAAGAALIFAAGILKFFPFAGGLAILSGARPRLRLIVLLLFGLAAALFLTIGRAEVNRVIHLQYLESGGDHPHTWLSFGSEVSVNTVVQKLTHVSSIALPPSLSGVLRWLGVLVMSLVSVRRALAIRQEASEGDWPRGITGSGFAAAMGIFVASFVLVRSYNYKFVFVALALPALCHWSRRSDQRGFTARIALVGLLLWMWSGLNGYAYIFMNIFVAWVVTGCFASLLMAWLLAQPGLWVDSNNMAVSNMAVSGSPA